jgi:O-antigen/teichoic acid export membrane protein
MRAIYQRKCVPKNSVARYLTPPDERKRMFKYGLFNNFNDAGTLLLGGATDNFFIAAFIDPISVGIYAFYGRLNEMSINVLPIRLFDNIIQPLFFSIKPEEANYRLRQFFTFLLDINLILQWAILSFVIVYHAELVRVVFGGKYIEYSWLLPLISFFSTLNSIAVPVTLVAQYQEKAEIILLSKIFVAYSLVAMIVLLPLLGLYGAILARGSAELLKNLFVWSWVRNRARWSNARPVLLTTLLLWGTIIATCFAAKTAVHAPPLVHMIFGALMCVIGLLVYVRTPAIAASDRTILASVFHGKEARLMQRLGLMKPADAPAPAA